MIHVFGYVCRHESQKTTQEHLLNSPNRTNFENWENADIAGNSVKNGRFRHSKHQNSVIFQDMHLKFCTRIHLTGFFHIYSVFLKIQKIPKYF